MRFVALLLLAAAAPPAPPPELASSPAMVAAEHQAEALLTPCKGLGLNRNDACDMAQYSFVQEYVKALSGKAASAQYIASDFSPSDRADCHAKPLCRQYNEGQWIGVPADPVRACTWRAVTLALQNPANELGMSVDRDELDTDCAPLSMVERARAASRAAAIAQRIADNPIILPSPNWWLPSSTFEPFEGHP